MRVNGSCARREMQCARNQIGNSVATSHAPAERLKRIRMPAITLKMPVTSETTGPKPVRRSILA